jgi:large subunit ribosomal protein L10
MRDEKNLLLDELKSKLQGSKSFIITRYSKLAPNTAHELRARLLKMGSELEVVKKRVFVKAAESFGVSLNVDEMAGHIGVVFSAEDALEAVKAVIEFGKNNEKIVEVIAGRVDGETYNAVEMKQLSELPSKNEMRAQLLGLFEAPMAQTLAVVEALLCSPLYCLENKAKQE